MKRIKNAMRAVRSACHRRRIVQIRRHMEYERGVPLTAEQMMRCSERISQHCTVYYYERNAPERPKYENLGLSHRP